MPPTLEAAKRSCYRRVFRGAAALVAWSAWSAGSLVLDYGVDPARITVAHPGAGPAFFAITRRAESRKPTVLFVGGDFERKGGPVLLEAFRRLGRVAHLLLVTTAEVPAGCRAEVIAGATPGSGALLDAYARSDVFCLPTLGDCTSVAIEEAMAGGLPVVTTGVGSNADTVTHGVNGLIVPGANPRALRDALLALIEDPGLRSRMGAAARETARHSYDAAANARIVLDVLESAA
jgi:glycosyltransferase involved in cell wall biosynthesis